MLNQDRGSVVAETALVLPTLLLVTTMLVSGLSVINTKFKCEQVASSVARAIERDEPQFAEFVEESIPDAKVVTTRQGPWVVVTVSKKVLFGIEVEGKSVALQKI